MTIGNNLFGPQSKYDHTLAFTYVARVHQVEGVEDISIVYFSDTICGLIDCLDENGISASTVELLGLYVEREIPLQVRHCVDENGSWLSRPEICKVLEQHYQETMELVYKGHSEHEPCSFEDRSRAAHGPF